MLYLSILANANLSGLSAVVQHKVLASRDPRQNSRDQFQIVYLLMAAVVIASCLFLWQQAEPEHWQDIFRPQAVKPWPGLNPLWFTLLAFSLQITFDAIYMIAYSRRQSRPTYYQAPEQNIVLTLLVGVMEEFSYRVIILHALLQLGAEVWLALVVSVMLYLLNHTHLILRSDQLKLYWILSRGLLGTLLGLTMFQGGILYAGGLHVIYNLYLLLAVPYFSRRQAHVRG